jgi:hypothetical protein
MRELKLKVIKENVSGADIYLSTYSLLKAVVDNPPKEGFTVDEMVKRLRLSNGLNEFKDKFEVKEFTDEHLSLKATFKIEDADFAKLKELFNEMKWAVSSTTIIELSKELNK